MDLGGDVSLRRLNAVNMGVLQILGPVIAVDTIGPESWGLVVSVRGAGALIAGAVMVKLRYGGQ